MNGSEGIPWDLIVIWYGITVVVYGCRYMYQKQKRNLEEAVPWINYRNERRLASPMAFRALPEKALQPPNVVEGTVVDLEDVRLPEARVAKPDWMDA